MDIIRVKGRKVVRKERGLMWREKSGSKHLRLQNATDLNHRVSFTSLTAFHSRLIPRLTLDRVDISINKLLSATSFDHQRPSLKARPPFCCFCPRRVVEEDIINLSRTESSFRCTFPLAFVSNWALRSRVLFAVTMPPHHLGLVRPCGGFLNVCLSYSRVQYRE